MARSRLDEDLHFALVGHVFEHKRQGCQLVLLTTGPQLRTHHPRTSSCFIVCKRLSLGKVQRALGSLIIYRTDCFTLLHAEEGTFVLFVFFLDEQKISSCRSKKTPSSADTLTASHSVTAQT